MKKSLYISTSAGKAEIINIVLLTNAFVWYYCVIKFLSNAMTQVSSLSAISIWSAHFAGIVIAAVFGALWTTKFKKRNSFISGWLVFGVLVSLISLVLNTSVFSNLLAISVLFGVSLGLGMPCLMGFYTQNTRIENRGRLGGLIILFTGLGIFLLGLVVTQDNYMNLLTLSLWRVTGLVIFLAAKPAENSSIISRVVSSSYGYILKQRSFILFLVPWIMFCLVNYLSTPIQNAILGVATVDFLSIIQNIIVGFSAVVGGLLIDSVGRKRMAMIGFVLFGLGYSAVGIFSTGLLSWYFFTFSTGLAWGILDVTFILTIWGDLSGNASGDKYYAIGMLPFFISKLLELLIGNSINSLIQPYALFSFVAFFLFLAVLPLVYAPETLPEKIMKDRELKGYVEKALKQAQKEAGKSQKEDSAKAEKENKDEKEEPEETPGYEEARKLAEKYY